MIIEHEKNVTAKAAEMPGLKNAAVKSLIGPEQGWSDYVLRVIEVGPEGHTPKHAHPWPHINYMLEGKARLYLNGREHDIRAGSFAYVPEGQEHQFSNNGEGVFRFICIVPKQGHK
ncbi:MAG: cupin domain-containing protein [Desulfobacteraceae bacterium]|nr:cupin domain-containing protein [Desulfobacteraceae bacterium]